MTEWAQFGALVIGGCGIMFTAYKITKNEGAKEARLTAAEDLLKVVRDAQLKHFVECDLREVHHAVQTARIEERVTAIQANQATVIKHLDVMDAKLERILER